MIPLFVKTYGIPAEDAEKPLAAYRSLNEFFIRRLQADLRPIDQNTDSLLSPVDATVTGIGQIEADLLITVKGQEYSINEFLDHSPIADRYRSGFFIVLYLSPADYHRVHSPVTGTISEKSHIPGKVYPVGPFALQNMRKVLSRNERRITCIQHNHGLVTVVKVGAMNVSSIAYVEGLADHLVRGEEFAYFEFGSTVVLLIENGAFQFRDGLGLSSQVRVGEAIGYWGDPKLPG